MKNGFGLPVVVAINAFPTDTAEEQALRRSRSALSRACPVCLSEVLAKGGEGGKALAEKVLAILARAAPSSYVYPLDDAPARTR